MIKRLYVDNYKCLVNFEAQLGDLTLVTGNNGVGKSSMFEVVFAVRQLLRGVAKLTDNDVFPARTLTRWQTSEVQVVELEVMIGADNLTYRLEVDHNVAKKLVRVQKEELHNRDIKLFSFTNGEVHLFRDNGTPGPVYTAEWGESALARVGSSRDNVSLTAFLDYIRKITICQINPKNFTAETNTEDPLLLPDGSNFVAWFRHIFQEHPDLFAPFTESLKEAMQGFSSIRLDKVGQETRAFITIFQQGDKRIELWLDELSDGQRVLLTIYALVLLTTGEGYTLLLDEPDNFVSLSEIQPWLVHLSEACGASILQTVICSHHPEIIDYLGGREHVLVLDKEISGAARIRRASDLAIEGPLKLSEVIARGWQK